MDGDFERVLPAARAGDEAAIAQLYRRYQPRLARYLASRLGADGEDVAAQVWLEVARGLHRFAGDEAGFRGWLFTIAARRLRDHVRDRSRRPATVADERALAAHVAGDDPAADAVDAVAAAAAVRQVVALLPPGLAEVVLLRVVGGLGTEEVARIVGRSPGAVRVMQHRALTRLARAFAHAPLEV
jgi:RNA polymerase sigma-70 factor (ECF subfamily)